MRKSKRVIPPPTHPPPLSSSVANSHDGDFRRPSLTRNAKKSQLQTTTMTSTTKSTKDSSKKNTKTNINSTTKYTTKNLSNKTKKLKITKDSISTTKRIDTTMTVGDDNNNNNNNNNNNKNSLYHSIGDGDHNSDDDDGSYEIAACCLCHCCLDYSDRAAFFRLDREDDYSTTKSMSHNNNSTTKSTTNNHNKERDNKSISILVPSGDCDNPKNKDDSETPTDDAVETTTTTTIPVKVEEHEGNGNAIMKIEDGNGGRSSTSSCNVKEESDVLKKCDIVHNNPPPIVKLEQCDDNLECTNLNGHVENPLELTASNDPINCSCVDEETIDLQRTSSPTCEDTIHINESAVRDENIETGRELNQSAQSDTATSGVKVDDHDDNADDNNKKSKKDMTTAAGVDNESTASSYYFRRDDPYLPESLYDPDNALVYCDTCDRLFHQKCHFVPIPLIPKGEWSCLICITTKSRRNDIQMKGTGTKSMTKSSKKQNEEKSAMDTRKTLDDTPLRRMIYSKQIFQSPPVAVVRVQEMQWESDPIVVKAKTELVQQWTSMSFNKTITTPATKKNKNKNKQSLQESRQQPTRLKRWLLQPIQQGRLAVTALTTLTSTRVNLQHCYSMKTGKPSQELVSNIVKLCSAKYKLRNQLILLNLTRLAITQYQQWYTLLEWVTQHQQQQKKQVEKDLVSPTNGTSNYPDEFVQRVLFPFGLQHGRRWEPRTPEFLRDNEIKQQYQSRIMITSTGEHLSPQQEQQNTGKTLTTPVSQPVSQLPNLVESMTDHRAPRNNTDDTKIPNEISFRLNTTNSHGTNHLKSDEEIKRSYTTVTAGSSMSSQGLLETPNHHQKDAKNINISSNSATQIIHNDTILPQTKNVCSSVKNKSSQCSHNETEFSLDQLICSCCLSGETTDENDLILCDGIGCYRSYHMKCVQPNVTMKELTGTKNKNNKNDDNQEEDAVVSSSSSSGGSVGSVAWFCPWCQAVANGLYEVQSHWYGDEWEKKILTNQCNNDNRHHQSSITNNSCTTTKSTHTTTPNDLNGRKDKEIDTKDLCQDENLDNEHNNNSPPPKQQQQHQHDDSMSLTSWNDVNDVFPEAVWEYETAMKLKGGITDNNTKQLLGQILGFDEDDNHNASNNHDDDDDLDVDGDFDLGSYEIQRRLELYGEKKEKDTERDDDGNNKNSDNDSGDNDMASSGNSSCSSSSSSSTHSSQATLVDMSSVELEIASDELDALSDVDVTDDDEDGDDDDSISRDSKTSNVNEDKEQQMALPTTFRRSRRLRRGMMRSSRRSTGSDSESNSSDSHHRSLSDRQNDPGRMDTTNILLGKRKRNAVDYRKLNDAIFGDWDAEEVAILDGGEDYDLINHQQTFSNKMKKHLPSSISTGKKRNTKKTRNKNCTAHETSSSQGNNKATKNQGKKNNSTKTLNHRSKNGENKLGTKQIGKDAIQNDDLDSDNTKDSGKKRNRSRTTGTSASTTKQQDKEESSKNKKKSNGQETSPKRPKRKVSTSTNHTNMASSKNIKINATPTTDESNNKHRELSSTSVVQLQERQKARRRYV